MKNEGKILEYLHSSFGWDVTIENADNLVKKIPYGYTMGAEYLSATIDGRRFVLIDMEETVDLRYAKKMYAAVKQFTQTPAILVIDSVDTHQRRSLIESRIDFIVPAKQVYLPSMATFITERGVVAQPHGYGTLSTVATLIVIYHLVKRNLSGMSVSDVAKEIGYSIKTTSIAISELKKKDLIQVSTEGRTKRIVFALDDYELWNKGSRIMENPVAKKLYTDSEIIKAIGVKASDTALGEVSMLQPPNQNSYAVYYRSGEISGIAMNQYDGKYVVELWKYNPLSTAKHGIVDSLSLALTYKDDDDPRIVIELKKLIDRTLCSA